MAKKKQLVVVETRDSKSDCEECCLKENCPAAVCFLNIGVHFEIK